MLRIEFARNRGGDGGGGGRRESRRRRDDSYRRDDSHRREDSYHRRNFRRRYIIFPHFTTICNEDGQEAGVTEEEVEEEAMIGTEEGMTPTEDVMIVMTDMAGVLEVVPALSVARTITGKETALRDTEKVSVFTQIQKDFTIPYI